MCACVAGGGGGGSNDIPFGQKKHNLGPNKRHLSQKNYNLSQT